MEKSILVQSARKPIGEIYQDCKVQNRQWMALQLRHRQEACSIDDTEPKTLPKAEGKKGHDLFVMKCVTLVSNAKLLGQVAKCVCWE